MNPSALKTTPTTITDREETHFFTAKSSTTSRWLSNADCRRPIRRVQRNTVSNFLIRGHSIEFVANNNPNPTPRRLYIFKILSNVGETQLKLRKEIMWFFLV